MADLVRDLCKGRDLSSFPAPSFFDAVCEKSTPSFAYTEGRAPAQLDGHRVVVPNVSHRPASLVEDANRLWVNGSMDKNEKTRTMNGIIRKYSARIGGKNTSFCLEKEFYDALIVIAQERQMNVQSLVNEINNIRETSNLSSSLRLFVIGHFRKRMRQSETVGLD